MITFTDLVISILIAYLIYLIFDKNKEDFTDNREAKSNINTIYNTDNLIVNNLVVDGAFNMIPRGCVVAWNNPNIPKGWALCNGQNGTPDLRGRFILGTGQGEGLSNRPFNEKGGEENHLLNDNEIPEHSHATIYFGSRDYLWAIVLAGKNCSDFINNTNALFRLTDIKPIKGDNVIQNTNPHNNMPPFFVLYYTNF